MIFSILFVLKNNFTCTMVLTFGHPDRKIWKPVPDITYSYIEPGLTNLNILYWSSIVKARFIATTAGTWPTDSYTGNIISYQNVVVNTQVSSTSRL